MNKEGMGVWRVMVGEHVYQRFTSSLDTSHLQPWNFYFTTVFGELGRAGTLWLVIAGGVLLIVQTVRERRLEQWLVILWFVLPMSLMSIGTSKIHHYAYPFLPPLALAAGYGPAWLLSAGRTYVDWIMNAVQSRIAVFESRGPWFRYLLTGLAVLAVVLSVVTFALGSVNLKIGAFQIFRNSHVVRPLVVAVILATLVGRGVVAARLLWPLAILLAIMPMDNYESMWRRTRLELHPLRSTRDCLLGIRSAELAAGRPAPGVYAIGEHRWFLHPHFYYLHPVGGWERSETFDPKAAERALFEPGQQRPVILDEETYRLIKANHPEMLFPRRTFGRVVLLTPGPYAACGTQTDPLPGQ
jgi:hypothetical protein